MVCGTRMVDRTTISHAGGVNVRSYRSLAPPNFFGVVKKIDIVDMGGDRSAAKGSDR
jgi:hypothetical protein